MNPVLPRGVVRVRVRARRPSAPSPYGVAGLALVAAVAVVLGRDGLSTEELGVLAAMVGVVQGTITTSSRRRRPPRDHRGDDEERKHEP